MDNIKIGKFISEIRKEKGMTQEEFASAIGVSQKTVSRWETGRNMPDYSVLSVICDTLGITVTELLNGKKIEGENISKAEASEANKRLIDYFKKKDLVKKIIGAVISFILMAVCMILLYRSYYYLDAADVSSSAKLEKAIKDMYYHDNSVYYEVIPKVLRTETIGGKVYALFHNENTDNNRPTDVDSGLVTFSKGFFGGYRNYALFDTTTPFVCWNLTDNDEHLFLWNVNELPDVAEYSYMDGRFREEYPGAPFLKVINKKALGNFDVSMQMTYYDNSGKEISIWELADKMGEDISGSSGGGFENTTPSGLFALEIITLLLGFVFIRYFLLDVIRFYKQKS